MGINGIVNQSQYAAQQMAKTQFQNPLNTSAAATIKNANTAKANAQTTKPAAYDDIAGRVANMTDADQYEALIQRFLSGESEMEGNGKPLTEDQIALRRFMREYRKTDMRTLPQMQADMQQANQKFLSYWKANGNGAPPPGRVISSDGSFHIFHSKAEKDEFMKKNTMSFLESVMSAIKAGKSGGTNQSTELGIKI